MQRRTCDERCAGHGEMAMNGSHFQVLGRFIRIERESSLYPARTVRRKDSPTLTNTATGLVPLTADRLELVYLADLRSSIVFLTARLPLFISKHLRYNCPDDPVSFRHRCRSARNRKKSPYLVQLQYEGTTVRGREEMPPSCYVICGGDKTFRIKLPNVHEITGIVATILGLKATAEHSDPRHFLRPKCQRKWLDMALSWLKPTTQLAV